jgi:hypothetical protein
VRIVGFVAAAVLTPKVQGARRVVRQRTTHIFDRADSLGVTSLLINNRFFRRSIPLAVRALSKEILAARTGAETILMCAMYVLVLEVRDNYRTSPIFSGRQQYLADVIIRRAGKD